MKKIGTLAPLFSLISEKTKEYGVIENGEPFIDWLVKTNQSAWQLLPLHEQQLIPGSRTEHVISPYKGYGIGLNPQYLSKQSRQMVPTSDELEKFMLEEKAWIYDYALFCALRDKFKTDDWRLWDEGLRKRDESTLHSAQKKLPEEIKHYTIMEWQLHKAFYELRQYAKENSVTIIGDLSFYISLQSPLLWANQDCFFMSSDYTLPRVSGVAFEKNALFGRQIWGHPLYNWENKDAVLKIISLWRFRLSYAAKLYDHLRFDHANGFYTYGSIDPQDSKNDEMKSGPGEEVFSELVNYARGIGLDVFAEDLALHLNLLRSTMKKLDLSGIKILSFAYDDAQKKIHEEYLHTEKYPTNSLSYTTNHDTAPLMGFLQELSEDTKKVFSDKFNEKYTTDKELALSIREAVVKSPSRISIVPIQDWLMSYDRINTPGTENISQDKNWRYKVPLTIEELPTAL